MTQEELLAAYRADNTFRCQAQRGSTCLQSYSGDYMLTRQSRVGNFSSDEAPTRWISLGLGACTGIAITVSKADAIDWVKAHGGDVVEIDEH